MIVGYAIRYINEEDEIRTGEYAPATKPYNRSTPDISKARLYKILGRAYSWGYRPQWNEIVSVSDDGTIEVVESRYRGITQYGDSRRYTPPSNGETLFR